MSKNQELKVAQQRIFELEVLTKKLGAFIQHGPCRWKHLWSRWKFDKTIELVVDICCSVQREQMKRYCLYCGKKQTKLI